MIEKKKLKTLNKMYYLSYGEIRELNFFMIPTFWITHWHEYKNNFYETRKEAEFALKYQNITRTETLKLPTWDDFKEEKFVKFSTPDKRILGLEAMLVVDLSKENEISEYSIVITDINDYEHNELFQSEFTEEGYLQACKKAKELFLEE